MPARGMKSAGSELPASVLIAVAKNPKHYDTLVADLDARTKVAEAAEKEASGRVREFQGAEADFEIQIRKVGDARAELTSRTAETDARLATDRAKIAGGRDALENEKLQVAAMGIAQTERDAVLERKDRDLKAWEAALDAVKASNEAQLADLQAKRLDLAHARQKLVDHEALLRRAMKDVPAVPTVD